MCCCCCSVIAVGTTRVDDFAVGSFSLGAVAMGSAAVFYAAVRLNCESGCECSSFGCCC